MVLKFDGQKFDEGVSFPWFTCNGIHSSGKMVSHFAVHLLKNTRLSDIFSFDSQQDHQRFNGGSLHENREHYHDYNC